MVITIVFLIIVIIVFVLVYANKKPNEQTGASEPSDEQLLANSNRMLLLGEVLRQAKEHNDTATEEAVLNMTYDGPMPEQNPDGSYTSIYSTYMRFSIAGINFRKGIESYLGKSKGYLTPEPTNKHDPNAIAIFSNEGHHLGYVPAEDTSDVRALGLPFPIPAYIEIEEGYDDDESRRYYTGIAMIEMPAK